MTKPDLGPVNVGDRLLVISKTYNGKDKDPIETVVTKAARVWITLTETYQVRSMARTWRMRLDTQDTADGTNYRDAFRTPEQHAWHVRISEAWTALTAAGINPSYGSPWRTDEDRLLALGAFLRQYDTDHPPR